MSLSPAPAPARRWLPLACLMLLSITACDRRDSPPPNSDTGASSSSPDTATTVIPDPANQVPPPVAPPVDCTGLSGQALDDCRIRSAVSPPPVATPTTPAAVPRDGADPEQSVDAPMTSAPPVDESTPP